MKISLLKGHTFANNIDHPDSAHQLLIISCLSGKGKLFKFIAKFFVHCLSKGKFVNNAVEQLMKFSRNIYISYKLLKATHNQARFSLI